MVLTDSFFAREPLQVAPDLLGKVLRHYVGGVWLSAMIIESEAYYLTEKGSHSSLGFTEKRKALFMNAGTIYMYYARGGDSFNISCLGEGNAVLIKAGIPYTREASPNMLLRMQDLNPIVRTERLRSLDKLCSGQTLLCRSLGLKVPHWNQKSFEANVLRMDDVGYKPETIIQTTRLGIPTGRDEHLLYRFIDYKYAHLSTSNPLTKRNWRKGRDYFLIEVGECQNL